MSAAERYSEREPSTVLPEGKVGVTNLKPWSATDGLKSLFEKG